ncbi:MAG: hypothetical protein HXS48_27655 [Theionarchaea archaeon]|nr:MAG: hypothetical protein AYK19_01910 [Theionarchaea archaeon DG-70-1]MBU7030739.1 hypothetical protein [Theionarchaea archaeon]
MKSKEIRSFEELQKFRWFERIFIAMLAFSSFTVYAAVKFYGQQKYGYAGIFVVFTVAFLICLFEWRNCVFSKWDDFIKSIRKLQ